jgi:isopenicillin-N N-acyltransferase-like protein
MHAEAVRERVVTVEGGHSEMGRQLGEQCRERISEVLDFIDREMPLSSAAAEESVDRYWPFIAAHAPHLIDELHGLAEGAGIPRWRALLIQIRFELVGYEGISLDGCTSFAIRSGERRLTGQNVDTTGALADMAIVLRMKPAQGPAKLMYTYFPGMIGYLGINALGLTCFANAVVSPGWRPGFPRYLLLRHMLEQRTVAEARQAVESIHRASSINAMLSDADGAITDLEIDVHDVVALDESDGCLAHSNHYRSAELRPRERLLQHLPDSATRLEAMEGELARLRAAGGTPGLGDVQDALRNHQGHPTSVCRHEIPDGATDLERSRTIASLIAEPEAGRMHVCFGNPCERDYVAIDIDG